MAYDGLNSTLLSACSNRHFINSINTKMESLKLGVCPLQRNSQAGDAPQDKLGRRYKRINFSLTSFKASADNGKARRPCHQQQAELGRTEHLGAHRSCGCTAVDRDFDASDISGIVRREIKDSLGNFLRFAHAAKWA